MSETYTMKAKCSNCGNTWVITITKGTLVDSMEKRTICNNCGCGDHVGIFPESRW